MGYQRKTKRIHLAFDGTEYDGLEVELRGLSLGGWLEITGLGDDVDNSAVAEQLRRFADSLISWNLEDEDGHPIPATRESVFNQDQDFMFVLFNAWMDAMAGVAAPLDETSPAGEPSLAASIPMEPLSPSLAS